MSLSEPLSDEQLDQWDEWIGWANDPNGRDDENFLPVDAPTLAELVRVYREHRSPCLSLVKLAALAFLHWRDTGEEPSLMSSHIDGGDLAMALDHLEGVSEPPASRPPCWSLPEGGVLLRQAKWWLLVYAGGDVASFNTAEEMLPAAAHDEFQGLPTTDTLAAARLAAEWERTQGATDA